MSDGAKIRGRRGPYQKHSDESLKADAAQYGTRNEFAQGNPGAYQTALQRGKAFMDDCCAHMRPHRAAADWPQASLDL